MATSKKSAKNKDSDDIFRIVLSLPNVAVLARLQKTFPMDAGPIKVNPKTKEVVADVFVTEKQIEYLKTQKVDLKVYENLSDIGRLRQKEVGRGDRFKNGTIPPKGLGKKLK